MKRKLLIMLLIISLISLVACQSNKEPVKGIASSKFGLGDIDKIKIIANKANIKAGCDPDYKTIKTANKNEKYDVLSKVGDWYAVKLKDNRIGFIPIKEAQPIIEDTKKPNISTNLSDNNVITPKITTPNNIPDTSTNPNIPKLNNKPNNVPYETNRDTEQNVNVNKPTGNLTQAERQMVNLVNQARRENGLPPLKVDLELTNVARIKSQDMIDNNYFSHNSPTYGSPFDMMKDFGIKYVHAGENIAGNSTVDKAHDSLMKSPGHRANILNKDFTHIGIGIKDGGPYGKMFTQMFISKPQ